MKQLTVLLTFIGLLLVIWPSKVLATDGLTQQIRFSPAGSVIELTEGIYEGNWLINKPLTLQGKGKVILRSCSNQPILSVTSHHVYVKNITIIQCSKQQGASAVSVKGDHHQFQQLQIETSGYGMKLDGAKYNKLSEIVIRGTNADQPQNGIDLWYSDHNQISQVKLEKVLDGLYLENSHHNQLTKNTIKNSRYGIHLMFSDGTKLIQNNSHHNVAGAMVMETKQTSIIENHFSHNQENYNSQGLFFYKAVNTDISRNQIMHNRIGISIDNSSQNHFRQNQIKSNFIAIQVNQSEKNEIKQNDFQGNIHQALAINSSDNQIEENFWDQPLRLDLTGDGRSDIPYHADPYFLSLTSQYPAYQIFFQSPGMTLLERLLKSPSSLLLTDQQPALSVNNQETRPVGSSTLSIWLFGLLLLTISCFAIWIGRKKI
jgi:nitrous oxidase accessory protein